jgi:hypothetical protein
MRSTSTLFAAAAAILSGVQQAQAQTFSDCNPTLKTDCKAVDGLTENFSFDFTQGKASPGFTEAAGTSLSYDTTNGAQFVISTTKSAPTLSFNKYIFFGSVEVVARSSPGKGTVSSVILQSDDLDEIDWEWLGSDNSHVESNFYGKGNTTTYDRVIYHDLNDPINQWYKYTIQWSETQIVWSINNTVVRTLPFNSPLAVGGKNFPQTPMQVKIGSWVGCADAAAAADPATSGRCSWAGGPIDQSDLSKKPYVMAVKSVTITNKYPGCKYSYGDQSGSFGSIKVQACDGTTGGSASGGVSSSATTSAPNTSTTKSGGVLVETSVTKNSTTSATATVGTTVTRATTYSTNSPTGSATSTGSNLSLPTNNAAGSITTKHSYGIMEFGVMVMGLGMGYLVM